jgi:hypothetical protein
MKGLVRPAAIDRRTRASSSILPPYGKGSQFGGPDALGTLNGDLLEVRYSLEMRIGSDFENAVYRRTE